MKERDHCLTQLHQMQAEQSVNSDPGRAAETPPYLAGGTELDRNLTGVKMRGVHCKLAGQVRGMGSELGEQSRMPAPRPEGPSP